MRASKENPNYIEEKSIDLHYNTVMKTIAKIDLKADGSGKKRLLDTMEAFNAACDDIAATCFKEKSASKFLIQQLVYHDIREKYGLSAQLVIRAIAKTCEAYKRDKSIQPKFRKHGSITYDARILTFKGLGTEFPQVSLTTLDGRRSYEINVRAYFAGRTDRINGQVDLVYRDGKFFLYATCDMPEDTPIEPDDVLGVDLGVVNIATDSTGEVFSNEKVEQARVRIHKHRGKLQRKKTKSAKRKLKKVSGKEARFRADTNHCISKHLVEKAKDTGCAIGLEDLTHINSRTTVRKSQRAERMSWAFFQLRSFLTYKAKLAGIPVVLVDPRNTSRQCSCCGHIDKANRRSQSEFLCVSCGHRENADINAAKNIRTRAVSTSLLSSATDLLKVG
jgi:IS605 OrfB family transposase